MILPHVDEKLADKVFPNGIERVGMPSGKNYVRTTTNYWNGKASKIKSTFNINVISKGDRNWRREACKQ